MLIIIRKYTDIYIFNPFTIHKYNDIVDLISFLLYKKKKI